MTRRVDIGVPEIRANETDCRVLRAVATRALAETGLRFSPVVASLAELAMSVGVGAQSDMAACSGLAERGIMVVTLRVNASGGRLANSYELTAVGLEVLRLAEKCGAFGPEGSGDE